MIKVFNKLIQHKVFENSAGRNYANKLNENFI